MDVEPYAALIAASFPQLPLRSITPILEDEANFAFQPVLIHADLATEHDLCDPLSGTLAGGQPLVERVLNEYRLPVDPTLLARVRFYVHIAPIYEIFFGLGTGDERHLQHGLQQLNPSFADMENPS